MKAPNRKKIGEKAKAMLVAFRKPQPELEMAAAFFMILTLSIVALWQHLDLKALEEKQMKIIERLSE